MYTESGKNIDLNHLEAKWTVSFDIKHNIMGLPEIIFLLSLLKNEDSTLNSLYRFDFTVFPQFYSGHQHVKFIMDPVLLWVSYIASL